MASAFQTPPSHPPRQTFGVEARPDVSDMLEDSLVSWDRDGRIISWNAASVQLYGWSRATAVGQDVAALLDSRPASTVSETEHARRGPDYWEGTVERRTLDRRMVSVEVRWFVRNSEDGEFLDVIELGRPAVPEALPRSDGRSFDVQVEESDLERAHANLMSSDGKYRHLFQYVPVSLWQVDSSPLRQTFERLRNEGVVDLGGYLDARPGALVEMMSLITVENVNDQTVRLFGGKTAADFSGPVTRYWSPSHQTFRRSMIAQFNNAKTYSEETVLRTLDGRDINVLYNIAVPPLHGGSAMSIVSLLDISERVRALKALQQSEARYRNLFRNMNVAMIQVDTRPLTSLLKDVTAAGIDDLAEYLRTNPEVLERCVDLLMIQEANAQAVRMFGASNETEMLRSIKFAWRTNPETLLRSVMARLSGATRFSEETRIDTLDGRVVDVLFTVGSSAPLSTAGISVVGFIDISDRVAAQAMLEKVQSEFAHASRVSILGELTTSIAHEVNQPLAGIMSCGEATLRWLSRPEPDIAEVTRLVTYMVEDAQRAADIVARVRDMAANRHRERTSMQLDRVIHQAMQILRQEFVIHGVELRLKLAPDLPSVRIDQVQIQQVIVNFALNAMQAMTTGKTDRPILTLSTSLTPTGQVRVCVDDVGPGLRGTDPSTLFESFYTTKPAGLGMGLSICHRIIEAHQGEIGAEDLPTGGARFHFTLPGELPDAIDHA